MSWVSPYILAIIVAWTIAHAIKYIVALAHNKELDFTHQIFISGGMPSSHAATSVAVWTVILMKDGYHSGLFGLATLFVLIVCYDAVKVRRSSGEQGASLTALIKEQKSQVRLPRVAKGHTPLEVFAGTLLGVLVGALIAVIF